MGAKFFYRNIDLVYFVNNKLINNNLITQKDRILLSFSGGQDSISFVFILNQLSSQLKFDITFFWCHHLWQTDSFYLMQQITKLSFLLQFNSCFPIPLNSISSELLARKWRQRCNYRVSLFYNYSKICLAHTFNDKVENIFLNFIRGTGLIGLAPLRWTQFISKSNITNEKHISCKARHNYLKRDSLPLQGIKMNLPPLAQRERDMLLTSFELAPKFYKSKICSSPAKMNSHPKFSCATIYNNWQDKKEREQLLFQGGTQKITNLTSSVVELRTDPRFVRRFVQISKPLPQKGIFCLATKARLEISTGVTNEYKAKSCRAFTSLLCIPHNFGCEARGNRSPATLATPNLSLINSCSSVAELRVRSKDYFTEQPMLCNWYKLTPLQGKSAKQDKWYFSQKNTIWVTSKTSSVADHPISLQERSVWGVRVQSKEHGKQFLNCGKDCYIVRPLLSINRIELNKICYFWKLPIYPDKSNQKVKFFRNRVRGQLLPTIKLFFNLNIENIFLQLAKIIETEDYCLTQIVNEFTKNTDVYHTKLNIYSKKKTITRNQLGKIIAPHP